MVKGGVLSSWIAFDTVMWSIALNVFFLLFGLNFSVEARGYFGRRPRPQTELPLEEKSISSKVTPAISVRDPPIRPQPWRCPRRRCTFEQIPDSCRQETFFYSANGRQCRGCDMNICEDRNLNSGSTQSKDQLTTGRGRSSIGSRRQVSRTQSAGSLNSNRRDSNVRVQNDFRNNELFDVGLQTRRTLPTLTERALSSRLPSGLDLLLSQLARQDLTSQSSGNSQDFGTVRGLQRRLLRESPLLLSSQNQNSVTDSPLAALLDL